MSLWTTAGCADKEASNPTALPSVPISATSTQAQPASTPTQPVAAQASNAATLKTAAPATSLQASCAPWAPAPQSLTTRSGGGRADFFRAYRYDFATGVLSVHDSDPFASGKEEKDPRVTRADKKLAPADKARIDKALIAICPDEAAMKAACAPGGCSRLVVKRADGETKVEHADTVHTIHKLFAPSFPDLRH